MSKNSLAPGYEYTAGEVTLPFSYRARVSSVGRPPSLDFPHEPNPDNSQVFVRIKGELWQFRCPWIVGKPTIIRYKGKDIDHLVRVEDGAYPEALTRGLTMCWFLGGMWYEESERKLYAPMHIEQGGMQRANPVAPWSSRKIVLATSLDTGRTWTYEGDILEPSTYYFNHDAYKFSGSCFGNGVSDYGFYADTRGGYFYLFPEEAWYGKGKWGAFWNVKAARCAIRDRMAPGAWRYFHNGSWDEPGLGGKSSTVAPSHLWGVIYSTSLQKYICMFPSNSDPVTPRGTDGVFIGSCSDLSKQDWTWGYCPEAMFGFMNLLNDKGDDLTSCGDTFRYYAYGAGNTFQRLDVELSAGKTRTLNLAPRYHFEAHPESSDAVLGRTTRIVGAGHPECAYDGSWAERVEPESYESRIRESATAGDSIQFRFAGSAIYWRALQSPANGQAEVWIDGARRATVDCYSPRSTCFARFAYILTGLEAGAQHTIRIVVQGEKHPMSTGTAIGHIAFEHRAESYKASAGFCSVMGKNNWRYESRHGSSWVDMRFAASDLVFTNYWFSDGLCAVGDRFQIPDAEDSARTWCAPHGGVVRIEGCARIDFPCGDGVKASIAHGPSELWPARLVAFSQPASHDLRVKVRQGDAIRFIVAKSSPTASSDKVFWDPVVSYTESEPAEWRPDPPSPRNIAPGAYARSKILVSRYRPFDAVDGSPQTAFVVHKDDPVSQGDDWLMLDLHATHMVDRYVVVSRPDDPEYRLADFILQQSDDGFTWTDVDRVAHNTRDRIERAVPEFTARYVRLYLPKGKPFCINELELYRTGGSPLEH